MNIYVLKRKDTLDYDVTAGLVVIAPSPRHAREVAAESASREGGGPWLDPDRASCELIGEAEPGLGSRVVLRDFWGG